MLGGVGVAQREIGLQQIESGGGSVPGRIVARRDQFHDLAQVAVHPEVARDGHEHVGPVAGRGEHFLINCERRRHILGLELFPRLHQSRPDVAGGQHLGWCLVRRGRSGSRDRSDSGSRGRPCGRGGLAGEAIEETHSASKAPCGSVANRFLGQEFLTVGAGFVRGLGGKKSGGRGAQTWGPARNPGGGGVSVPVGASVLSCRGGSPPFLHQNPGAKTPLLQ